VTILSRREAADSRLGFPADRRWEKRKPGRTRQTRRECVPLSDPTDCLLEAYDCVAHRAYEKFLERGSTPGRELEDWLSAERELLPGFPVDIGERGQYVYALANFPGLSDVRVSVGIESRWLVILAQPRCIGTARARSLRGDLNERPADNSICVLGLPSEVDPSRSIAVLADGVLGIRMPKHRSGGDAEFEEAM